MFSLTELTAKQKYKKMLNLDLVDNTYDINKNFNITNISKILIIFI